MFNSIDKFERKCDYLRSCLDKYLDIINIHTYEPKCDMYKIYRSDEDLVYDGEVVIPGYFTVNKLQPDDIDKAAIHLGVRLWSHEVLMHVERSHDYIANNLECFDDDDMLTAILCVGKLNDLKEILWGLKLGNVADIYLRPHVHDDDEPEMVQEVIEEEIDEDEYEVEYEPVFRIIRNPLRVHRHNLRLQVA